MTEKAKFVRSPEGFVRMAYRTFKRTAGHVHQGHQHDVDHGTVLVYGKVRIDWRRPDGATGSSVFDASEEPVHFMVQKDVWHDITPLEDSLWLCCFLPPEGYEDDLLHFWNERSIYEAPATPNT